MSKKDKSEQYEISQEAKKASFMLEAMGMGINSSPIGPKIYGVWNTKHKRWCGHYPAGASKNNS